MRSARTCSDATAARQISPSGANSTSAMPGPRSTRLVAAEPAVPAHVASARGRVVVDSGPLIALFNARDHWHAPVLSWLRENQHRRLVTTWPVLTEVCAMLARQMHHAVAIDF